MTAVQENIEQYQWIKGDNFGTIVSVESTDSEFINFTDGSRVFKAIQSEFLEKINDGVIPLPGADKANMMLNQNTKSTIKQVSSISQPVQKTTPVKEESIMGKMISKMSKKNVVNVPIQINLNIPTPELYSILSGGMEEGDLNEEIMEVALSQIQIEKLQEYIKGNVTMFLSEYYQS